MFNVLKDHKSRSPIQKHILKGFLRQSQCLLNVISAASVHQRRHWKAPGAADPPPSAVQTYATSPVMVSRCSLSPDHACRQNTHMLHLPFQPWCWPTMLFRKLRGAWFTYVRGLNIDRVIISAFQGGHCILFMSLLPAPKRPVVQDSGVGGVQCVLPAICGTSCALSLLGFHTSVLLMPLLKTKSKTQQKTRTKPPKALEKIKQSPVLLPVYKWILAS